MAKRTAIIIGSGISGLSAGCFAQKNGFQTKIFEHHYAPGGVAACWKRKNFLIDGGLHFATGYKPGTYYESVFKTVGCDNPALYADMDSFGKYHDEESNVCITIGKDLKKFVAEAKAKAPADASIIDEIYRGSQGLKGIYSTGKLWEKPPELTTLFDRLKVVWELKKHLKYMGGKFGLPVCEYTKSMKTPWLKKVIDYAFLPEIPVWFLFMLLSGLEDGHLGFVKNGSKSFCDAMEKQYKAYGGEIQYKSTVTKILVKDSKAHGIKLADGKEHYADNVISTGDGYNTIYNLLEGKYTSKKIDEMYKTSATCRPYLFASYGVNQDFAKEPPLSTYFLKTPIKYDKFETKSILVRITNYSDIFAPKGKSVLQAEIESEFDYWDSLRKKDKKQYVQAKNQLSDEIIKRLEPYYPGFSKQIEMTDIATPSTTHRFTLNRKGSWGGFSMSPNNLKGEAPRTLPGLNNFYMAGHWTHSTGMVPCLYSGKNAAELMAKKS